VNTLDLWSIARGTPVPPAPRTEVTAGGATLLLDGGDVRYYRVAGQEILRRVYVAVRNEEWETLPAVVSPVQVHRAADGSVRASYQAVAAAGPIEFSWAGTIELDHSGALTYRMDGTAGSRFDYARIGLNILHPPSLAGRRYRAATAGGELASAFPGGIGPQPFADGEYFPLFPAFRALHVCLDGASEAHFELDGDDYEIEDQRNWLDASYKTYSTPMSLGIRHADPGDVLRQQVHVYLTSRPGPARRDAERPGLSTRRHPVADVRLTAEPGRRDGAFPAIGLGMASHHRPLSPAEASLLGALRLSHLRADVRLSGGEAGAAVAAAVTAARASGCGLELAVFTDTASAGELASLHQAMRGRAGQVRRLLAFSSREPVTSAGVVAAVREAAGAAVPTFGGTNLYFGELNRDRPDPVIADGFAFSANPQVHAADDRSMTEAPLSFADMLTTARSFLGGRALAVTPITLLARFNADAPGAGTAGDGTLPPADHRQASLLCAAFTALSAKYLAAGGAESATFYETTGDRGVIAGRDGGAAGVPPGAAYPVYDVLAVLSTCAGRPQFTVESSDPLSAAGLGWVQNGMLRMLVINATGQELGVGVAGLESGPATIRVLDAPAVADWWGSGRPVGPLSSPVCAAAPSVLTLGPYAVALIEAAAG
jgi:D-apionolactonase